MAARRERRSSRLTGDGSSADNVSPAGVRGSAGPRGEGALSSGHSTSSDRGGESPAPSTRRSPSAHHSVGTHASGPGPDVVPSEGGPRRSASGGPSGRPSGRASPNPSGSPSGSRSPSPSGSPLPARPGAGVGAQSGEEERSPTPPRLAPRRGLFLTSPTVWAPAAAADHPLPAAAQQPHVQRSAQVPEDVPATDFLPPPSPMRRRGASVALSPERPPHFLASTQRALAALMGPGPLEGSPAAGAPGLHGTSLTPSYALVQKRPPTATFSPARSPAAPPRYSREPGPGHYEPQRADAALSRLLRSPAPVFGTAPRPAAQPLPGGPDDSPTRHAAAAEVAWLERDAAAALDSTKRRAPAALILPAPPPRAEEASEGGDAGAAPPPPLAVRYTLVEGRVRGTPLMRRPEPSVVVEDEQGQPLERMEAADPWGIDAAVRPRRPAWGFPAVGHFTAEPRPLGRDLLDLAPVYQLVERRLLGGPDFGRQPDRDAGDAERARRLRRLPGAGDYDVEAAWGYLCRRAPQVLMRVAAPRWAAPHEGGGGDPGGDGDGSDDGAADADVRQRRQAFLELSAALDCIRPRPPAWGFSPLLKLVRRDGGGGPRGRGFGPALSFDVDIGLVRRRLPGALPFGAGPPRQGLLLDPARLHELRHVAPGTYDVVWRAVEAVPRAADFARGTGHQLDDDEPPPPDDGGELPYGARLLLDVAAAREAVLPRRVRAGPAAMALALGRAEDAAGADPAYRAATAHLPLPDPDLDLPYRPRPRNVVLQGGAGGGHLPPVPQPSALEALRGPGAYFPEGAEQALAAVGPSARAVDFSRGPERELGAGDGSKPSVEEVLEGNRLVLSPHTALDHLRPRPHAALIPPRHAGPDPRDPPAAEDQLPYFHAAYDTAPGLGLALRRPPGAPAFGELPGRDPPLRWPAGIQPAAAPYGGAVGFLGAEEMPLTALAGHRAAPGGPDFAAMLPRAAAPATMDGQRLDLRPEAAADALRRRPPGPPNLAAGADRPDWAALDGRDPDLTAWLAYNPRLSAVRRHLVAPLPLPLGRQLGREAAQRADPRVGDDAVGDLDAGVYRVRHRLVWRSAPAIDFGRAAWGPRAGVQPGALPADPDAGNMLLLQPAQPRGWRPPAHAGSPTRQPFGRGDGRWEQPGADPATGARGDAGGCLLLRHSADDLAALRRRATAANAPAVAWGWMTARRDAQVLQPDPALPPRPRLPPPALPRVGGLLVRRPPPPGCELALLQALPPADPRVVAVRRRDRVLRRMLEAIRAERASVADV